jgi:hypothetical protein
MQSEMQHQGQSEEESPLLSTDMGHQRPSLDIQKQRPFLSTALHNPDQLHNASEPRKGGLPSLLGHSSLDTYSHIIAALIARVNVPRGKAEGVRVACLRALSRVRDASAARSVKVPAVLDSMLSVIRAYETCKTDMFVAAGHHVPCPVSLATTISQAHERGGRHEAIGRDEGGGCKGRGGQGGGLGVEEDAIHPYVVDDNVANTHGNTGAHSRAPSDREFVAAAAGLLRIVHQAGPLSSTSRFDKACKFEMASVVWQQDKNAHMVLAYIYTFLFCGVCVCACVCVCVRVCVRVYVHIYIYIYIYIYRSWPACSPTLCFNRCARS